MRGFGRIFRRGEVYWVAYSYRGHEYRESSESSHETDARRLLKRRLTELGRGKLVDEERLMVNELLEDLGTDSRIQQRRSLGTLETNLKAVRAAFGIDRAVDITTPRLRKVVAAWQAEGRANATINRRLAALQRAFSLAREAGKLTAA